jgi:hypothetical protein
MKAEHRRELQTNALADRLGRMLQTVKTPPKKRSLFYWILALAAIVVVVGYWWIQSRRATEQARLWDVFQRHDMSAQDIMERRSLLEGQNTPQGRAERFQLAWNYLWGGFDFGPSLQEFRVGGIKYLLSDPRLAILSLGRAKELYTELAKECKDDPILGAEAVYGLAVIEETLAAASPLFERETQMDNALRLYRDVEETYPKSTRAAEAAQRAKDLKDDNKRRSIGQLYATLNARIIPQLLQMQQDLRKKQ